MCHLSNTIEPWICGGNSALLSNYCDHLFNFADDFQQANRIANLAMETSTFDTSDSEEEEYTSDRRRRKRVYRSSSESSDAADASPPFKRPLAMQITAAKSAPAGKHTKAVGSKCIGEAAKRRLDYRPGTAPSTVSSPAASSAPASNVELPMAGIVTISLMFLLDW